MDAVRLDLAKFKDLRPVDDVLKEALQYVIKQLLGVLIDKKNITVQKWTVYFKVPAALKSEIFIHREKILEKLEQELGRKGIKQVL